MNEGKNEITYSTEFWIHALRHEGITPKDFEFNDLITGKKPPVAGSRLIGSNLNMSGKKVDVYHLGGNSQRLYLHIKD